MSEATLKAIHDAIREHVKDLSGDAAAMVDWHVCYGVMRPNPNVPNNIGYSVGYACSEDSTPQATVGLVTMALEDLMETVKRCPGCPDCDGPDD